MNKQSDKANDTKSTKADPKADSVKQDAAEFAAYDTARTAGRDADVLQGTVTGYVDDVEYRRERAIKYALRLHDDKGVDAAKIVAEAIVFEAYLSGAPAKPTVAPDNVPKQNGAFMVPPA